MTSAPNGWSVVYGIGGFHIRGPGSFFSLWSLGVRTSRLLGSPFALQTAKGGEINLQAGWSSTTRILTFIADLSNLRISTYLSPQWAQARKDGTTEKMDLINNKQIYKLYIDRRIRTAKAELVISHFLPAKRTGNPWESTYCHFKKIIWSIIFKIHQKMPGMHGQEETIDTRIAQCRSWFFRGPLLMKKRREPWRTPMSDKWLARIKCPGFSRI